MKERWGQDLGQKEFSGQERAFQGKEMTGAEEQSWKRARGPGYRDTTMGMRRTQSRSTE